MQCTAAPSQDALSPALSRGHSRLYDRLLVKVSHQGRLELAQLGHVARWEN